ncbi:MAG: flavodoxin domain-containing protein [Myxococcota bacterium]|nr:flavodoxin domain-containing protein [Myxococcota bacterium]
MSTKRIPVFFGTESGNAEYCAETVAKKLSAAGYEAEAIDMEMYEPEHLVEESMVLVVTSTHGNGDPPANAAAMLEYLQASTTRLDHIKFAVCALGDSSFAYFAQCGKDFDEALGKRGAQRMFERIECDDDYDEGLEQYQTAILSYLHTH